MCIDAYDMYVRNAYEGKKHKTPLGTVAHTRRIEYPSSSCILYVCMYLFISCIPSMYVYRRV
jgi:hypothetical protein